MIQEEKEEKGMGEAQMQEVVLLLRTIAYVADTAAPGCFASEYIHDFRKAYETADVHRATVERVLEELELDDDTPPESVIAPLSPGHEDDEFDDAQEEEEEEKGQEKEGSSAQEQKIETETQPAPRTSAAVLEALAREKKALEKMKRRSAKSLSYLSAGLADPSVSLRTSIIRVHRAGDPPHPPQGGVKRMHP